MNIDIQNLNLNNMCVIDIRDNADYVNGHISNSINITNDELVLNPEIYLSKNKIYYFYCQKGIISLKLSTYLNNLGYNTYSIKGGYTEWKCINNIN